MTSELNLFADRNELSSLLQLDVTEDLQSLFTDTLFRPAKDLLSRPKKDIRSNLVRLGFSLASLNQPSSKKNDLLKHIDVACEILEILHAGSLIVDDIQDGTTQRRGGSSLHLIYGTPIALNVGNWLYFIPAKKIERMNLSPSLTFQLLRECQHIVFVAHYGQALDVGVSIDLIKQEKVAEVVQATIQLKTGALTSFALKIGAILASMDPDEIRKLDSFGKKLGNALQMFDDLGNLTSQKNPEKKGEDLKLRRPSFAFSMAAQFLPPPQYQEFLRLLNQEDKIESSINFLMDHGVCKKGKAFASSTLEKAIVEFKTDFKIDESQCEFLSLFQNILETSYE